MKKQIIMLLMMFLCIGLFGCGSQEKSQYDESRNQKVEAYGITMQLPETWKLAYDSDNFLEYGEKGIDGNFAKCLDIRVDPNGDMKNSLEWARESIKKYKESKIAIAGMVAHMFEFNEKQDGKTVAMKVIFFQTNEGNVCISFYSSTEIGYNDFDKAVNSIELKATKNEETN